MYHEECPPLAALEVSASGGPFRQFSVRLEDGTRIYVCLQKILPGIELSPARPTNHEINETIGTLARSRAFG